MKKIKGRRKVIRVKEDNKHYFMLSEVVMLSLVSIFFGIIVGLLISYSKSMLFDSSDKKVNEISKIERHKLVDLLKEFKVTISGFRPVEEAIVTAGGINIKEINPKTMESKIIAGLFFAGEIIDVDAYTGGFNLQIAYSTGYTAGLNIE